MTKIRKDRKYHKLLPKISKFGAQIGNPKIKIPLTTILNTKLNVIEVLIMRVGFDSLGKKCIIPIPIPNPEIVITKVAADRIPEPKPISVVVKKTLAVLQKKNPTKLGKIFTNSIKMPFLIRDCCK